MAIFASAMCFGAADLFFYYAGSWVDFSWMLDALIGATALRMWCHYDARIIGYPLSGRLGVWIFLFALIAFPYYLVQSRGWKGAGKLGLGLPIFVLSYGAYRVSWWVSEQIALHSGYFS